MNRKLWYALWGGMFIVCALLGFIPNPQGWVRTTLFLLSLLFFLPPAVLMIRSSGENRRKDLLLIRNLSLLSLGLSLAGILLNIVTAMGSQSLGLFLNALLTVVSAPMICSGQWALSLFLWACLMVASIMELQKP